MKKSKVFPILLLCLALCGASACAKPTEKTPSGEEGFKFAVISDSQLVPNSSNYTSVNLENTLQAIREESVDVVVFAGDIVDYGAESTYDYYKKVEDAAFEGAKKPEFVYIMGNHETYNASGAELSYQQLAELFEDKLGQTKNVHKVVEGYHFIGISSDGTDLSCNYSEETLGWARSCMEESVSEDPSRPIFVTVHAAPEDTVLGSEKETEMGNPALNGLFEDFPQAVVFSGHSHKPLANPRSIWQGDYTVVNTQAIAYTSVATEGVGVIQPGSSDYRYPEGYNEYGYGLICTVEEGTHKVVMERMNFTLDKKLGADFVLESFKKEDFVYTDARFERDVPPEFPSDTQLVIEKDILSTEKFSGYLQFRAATHPDCVIYYKVVVDNGTEEKEYLVYTDYFKGAESMAKNCELYVPGFLLAESYDVSVYAVSPYLTLSEPLLAHIDAQQ